MPGASFTTPEPSAKPARRRLQWSVRGLLLLTALCAFATTFVLVPRVRERAAIDWLEAKGAGFETKPIGPNWLRNSLGDRYLNSVVSADLTLCSFADADLVRLAACQRLRKLELLGTNVTIDCVERTANQWQGISVDALLAESMYMAAAADQRFLYHSFDEAIVDCQIAARWKAAWADSRGRRADQIAARQRCIDNLNQCAAALHEADRTMTPLESAMLKAALAAGRLELAEVSHQPAAIDTARRDGEVAGWALVQQLDEAVAAAANPFRLDAARELATRLLLKCRSNDRRAADAARIIAVECRQWELLLGQVEPLYRAAKRGGEAERMALGKVNLALARGHLADIRGDRQQQRDVLSAAIGDSELLREANDAAYSAGVSTMFDSLTAHRRAAELEMELAHAQGNQEAGRAARDRWLTFLAEKVKRVMWGGAIDLFSDESDKYFVLCNYALAQYDEKGAALFDQPILDLVPPLPFKHSFPQDDQIGNDQMDNDLMDDDLMDGDLMDDVPEPEVNGSAEPVGTPSGASFICPEMPQKRTAQLVGRRNQPQIPRTGR